MDARKQLSAAAAVFPFPFNRNVGAPGRKFMRKKKQNNSSSSSFLGVCTNKRVLNVRGLTVVSKY
jgi:hypothetical protein